MKSNKKKQRWSQSSFLFNPMEYLTDTADFTNQEHGIYIQLLSLQWKNKGISPQSFRHFVSVGGALPKSNEQILHVLRNVLRDDAKKEHVIELLNSMAFSCFDDCWEHIKTKFNAYDDGTLKNSRLEEEREAVAEHIKDQQDRTKRATEVRLKKQNPEYFPDERNEIRYEERDVERNEIRDDERNDSRDVEIPHNVTSTNTNTNTKGNTENKKNARAQKSLDCPPEKPKNPEQPGCAPREISIHRPSGAPLRLFLAVPDEKYIRVVQSAILGHADKFLMHHRMMNKPDTFQVFILESFFRDKSATLHDTVAGMLVREFTPWLNYNYERLEREYNTTYIKTKEWFFNELDGTNGLCVDVEMRKSFVSHYTRVQPSGILYFQTLRNYNVHDALEKWVNSTYRKVSAFEKTTGNVVVPADGMTLEEMDEFYKQE